MSRAMNTTRNILPEKSTQVVGLYNFDTEKNLKVNTKIRSILHDYTKYVVSLTDAKNNLDKTTHRQYYDIKVDKNFIKSQISLLEEYTFEEITALNSKDTKDSKLSLLNNIKKGNSTFLTFIKTYLPSLFNKNLDYDKLYREYVAYDYSNPGPKASKKDENKYSHLVKSVSEASTTRALNTLSPKFSQLDRKYQTIIDAINSEPPSDLTKDKYVANAITSTNISYDDLYDLFFSFERGPKDDYTYDAVPYRKLNGTVDKNLRDIQGLRSVLTSFRLLNSVGNAFTTSDILDGGVSDKLKLIPLEFYDVIGVNSNIDNYNANGFEKAQVKYADDMEKYRKNPEGKEMPVRPVEADYYNSFFTMKGNDAYFDQTNILKWVPVSSDKSANNSDISSTDVENHYKIVELLNFFNFIHSDEVNRVKDDTKKTRIAEKKTRVASPNRASSPSVRASSRPVSRVASRAASRADSRAASRPASRAASAGISPPRTSSRPGSRAPSRAESRAAVNTRGSVATRGSRGPGTRSEFAEDFYTKSGTEAPIASPVSSPTRRNLR